MKATTTKRVLVVDDDDSVRFVLTRALERMGHEVVIADDGADVPELAEAQSFDLIVLDLYMPGMNGFETVRTLRHALPSQPTKPRVRVLVVSGETHPASIDRATMAGADAFLAKPIDLDLFGDTVRGLLSRD